MEIHDISILCRISPGCRTVWHKSGTSQEIRDVWQLISHLRAVYSIHSSKHLQGPTRSSSTVTPGDDLCGNICVMTYGADPVDLWHISHAFSITPRSANLIELDLY